MKLIEESDLQAVSGGAEGVWYRIGATWASWYQGAVSLAADGMCAIDSMDGSLAD